MFNKTFSARSGNSGYESDAVSPVVRIQFFDQPNIQSRKVPLRDEAIQSGSSRDNSINQGTEFWIYVVVTYFENVYLWQWLNKLLVYSTEIDKVGSVFSLYFWMN